MDENKDDVEMSAHDPVCTYNYGECDCDLRCLTDKNCDMSEDMDITTMLKHERIMDDIQGEWLGFPSLHLKYRDRIAGIRSSQISALVMYLIKKGVIK